MIPVRRVTAPRELRAELGQRAAKVKETGGDSAAARQVWRSSDKAKREVRQLLQRMAPGVQRCMYCGDSLGTDIDHFQPLAVAPLRAFEWVNHLLACSHCNSNEKRDDYPCDESGECLLVDPSAEDPADHLTLLPVSGLYDAQTRKGEETIRAFGLNRKDLVLGRKTAFVFCRETLLGWHARLHEGDTEGAAENAEALRLSPFADVLRSMGRLYGIPQAEAVLTGSVRAALGEWLRASRR